MATTPPRTLYDCARDEILEVISDQPRYRVDQIFRALYTEFKQPSEMTTLPLALREALESSFAMALHPVTEEISEDGATIKFLWGLSGGSRIETVLMLYPDRATVCVSTQSGCAMACGFCATGQAGFTRHLSTGEIVEQVVRAARRARDLDRRVSNIVYMGMGEPLANEEPVWESLERVHDEIGISARHLTVSTVGIVPGIRRLAERPLPVNLAVSLHAANDELRNELVPINRRYPLSMLVEACADYLDAKGRRLTFEWALISDTNDRAQDARELAEICRTLPIPAHVNLIPLNPTPGYLVRGSSPQRVRTFCDHLVALGVNATIRRNRGTDISAACGQLAAGQPVRITSRQP